MTPHAQRLHAIQEGLTGLGVSALLITHAANRRYLTGFTGSAGHLIVSDDGAELVVDGRYEEQAAAQAPDVTVVHAGQALMARTGERLSAHGPEIGFEADEMTVRRLEQLREHAEALTFVSTRGVVERLRMAKSQAELSAIEQAVAISDAAMERAYQLAEPGMTEVELSWALERWMREHGAEAMAFDIIVAGGENSALPHHRPGQRPLAAGEVVLIDMGAVVDGYHSDITRTFTLGPPDAHAEHYQRVWQLVASARDAAVTALRPGMTGVEVDTIARELIRQAGHGDDFGHGLGHGVGLQVHEGPRLSPKAPEDVDLPVGCVVTVEPGVYLPGRFGVRLEDLVVLEENGARVLTQASEKPHVSAGTH